MTERITLSAEVPGILIWLPFEGEPAVLSPADSGNRARAYTWLRSKPALADLLERARDLRRGDFDVDDHDDDDHEHNVADQVAIWRDYANWPTLSPRDLVVVDAVWLRSHGVVTEHARILDWNEDRWSWVEEAEVDDPRFRPEGWPPSLRELEDE